MNKRMKFLTAATILASGFTQMQGATAAAHMEPKAGDGMEKCYGVAKANRNDCASKVNKHSCAGMAKKDRDPNEWIEVKKGLCAKLAGGSTTSKGD